MAEEVKKENVRWLGNLNLALLSIKDFNLIFSKTGDSKILLIRQGEIIDLGQNLNLQEIEPYPLKIFFNIVSGKLIPNDIVLVFTKEVFDFFVKQNLLDKISQTKEINRKKIKEIIPSRLFSKDQGSKVSGICFLALLEEESIDKDKLPPDRNLDNRTRETIYEEKEKFSLSQVFSPLIKPIEKIKKLPSHLSLKKKNAWNLARFKNPGKSPISNRSRPQQCSFRSRLKGICI